MRASPITRAAGALAAGALREGYRRGEFTPVDVARAVLERIEARGADHVWIGGVPPDALLARAAALPPGPDLPLYGVPFAVKDNIDVAGLPTTAGCPEFGYLPAATAPAVRRLEAAGALLVGKTNLDQFATGLTGSRSPYGAVESVFGGGLVAGGSSSGSAVAVAAGLVGFALGTDTAGSGRVPAALNGIVGLKPTRGLVSTAGVVPACRSLDCVSVFASGVADAAAVLGVLAGPERDDPYSRAGTAAPLVPPGAVRLGAPAGGALDFFGDGGQRDRYAAGVDALLGLVGSGVAVDPAPFLAAGELLYEGPWVAERLSALDPFIRSHPDAVLPVTRAVLERGRGYSAVDAFTAAHRLRQLSAAVTRGWREVDVLVLPTVGTTVTLAEVAAEPVTRNTMLGRYTQFANLLDLAVVTVPNGFTAAGRPASLSLIGPAWSEPTLCALAGAFLGGGPAVVPAPAPDRDGDGVLLAVVGHHLTGERRSAELLDRGARSVRTTRTAPCYRLYRLPTGVPGLVRTGTGGVAIEVELWHIPGPAVGGFLGGVAAPLSLGRVRLADGQEVLGFLCEQYAVAGGAEDISASGGWRAYRRATSRA
jgi:allophanate hydrolase